MSKPQLWTPGDWNALFGFGTNILVNLLVLTGLLRFVLKMPDELVFGRIIPAAGLMMALSTLYTARQNLDKSIRAKVIEKFTEDFVFQTTIPRAVAVGEATATLQAVVETNAESAASFAFRKLAAEMREVLGDEEVLARTAERKSR